MTRWKIEPVNDQILLSRMDWAIEDTHTLETERFALLSNALFTSTESTEVVRGFGDHCYCENELD